MEATRSTSTTRPRSNSGSEVSGKNLPSKKEAVTVTWNNKEVTLPAVPQGSLIKKATEGNGSASIAILPEVFTDSSISTKGTSERGRSNLSILYPLPMAVGEEEKEAEEVITTSVAIPVAEAEPVKVEGEEENEKGLTKEPSAPPQQNQATIAAPPMEKTLGQKKREELTKKQNELRLDQQERIKKENLEALDQKIRQWEAKLTKAYQLAEELIDKESKTRNQTEHPAITYYKSAGYLYEQAINKLTEARKELMEFNQENQEALTKAEAFFYEAECTISLATLASYTQESLRSYNLKEIPIFKNWSEIAQGCRTIRDRYEKDPEQARAALKALPTAKKPVDNNMKYFNSKGSYYTTADASSGVDFKKFKTALANLESSSCIIS